MFFIPNPLFPSCHLAWSSQEVLTYAWKKWPGTKLRIYRYSQSSSKRKIFNSCNTDFRLQSTSTQGESVSQCNTFFCRTDKRNRTYKAYLNFFVGLPGMQQTYQQWVTATLLARQHHHFQHTLGGTLTHCQRHRRLWYLGKHSVADTFALFFSFFSF